MPRSAKGGNDTRVQGTNDSSIVSKCSITAQGYFQDEYLRLFVSKTARRSPLINRGYYIRARAVDDYLKQFLATNQDKQKQIISLGAGFDSAFFRLQSNGHLTNTTFYEVDFPDLVKRKGTIIKSNEELSKLLINGKNVESNTQNGVYLTSENYHLLGVDLTDLNLLQRTLKLLGISSQAPTFLLSECVLTYMRVSSSDALIQWAAESFPNAVFLTYEQIHPEDAFGYVMQKHFDKLNSRLKAIGTYPTTEAQLLRLKNLGWQGITAVDMNSYYTTRVSLTERMRVERLEPFDEFEEWHLQCNHYAVIAGYNGDCAEMMEYFKQGHQMISTLETSYISTLTPLYSQPSSTPVSAKPVRRFGHASALLHPDKILVSGGFGETEGRHNRLGDFLLIDLKTKRLDDIPVSPRIQELGPRMHHTLTALSQDASFLIFGGRSSPSKPTNSTIIIYLDIKTPTTAEHTLNQIRPTSSESFPSCPNGSETITGVSQDGIKENTDILSDEDLPLRCPETISYTYLQVDLNDEAPTPRWRHSAIRAVRKGQECVVIFGGRSSGDVIFGDCWCFDVNVLKWKQLDITGAQATPSHSHTACLWQDTRMVIAGGLSADLCPLNSVYVIDVESCVSQEIELTPTLSLRYSHTAHVVDDKLFLIGGINPHGAHCYTVSIVNLTAATSCEYSLPVFDVDRPLMFHGHTSELLSATKILIIGGGGNCFSFGTHLNDTPILMGVPL
ncbi:tRNA wybutosine-synthesizing protein 4-like [Asterias amurensis]|uniref:tRNA wybutosine-synthesizing protein 4-like n=1 Tax=Asterias amurensis TaxID=7602 RepID=UPI003AB453B3